MACRPSEKPELNFLPGMRVCVREERELIGRSIIISVPMFPHRHVIIAVSNVLFQSSKL